MVPDRQRYAVMIRAEAEANFPVLMDMDNGYAMSLNLVFWVGSEMQNLTAAAGIDPPLNIRGTSPGWFLCPRPSSWEGTAK